MKYSNSTGIASFFGIAQGSHSYSVVPPEGMRLVSGEDPFKRPLGTSGTTIIEWLPLPGTPWPEDQPWLMAFTFEVGEVPEEPTDEVSWLAMISLPFALGAIIFGLCIAPVK